VGTPADPHGSVGVTRFEISFSRQAAKIAKSGRSIACHSHFIPLRPLRLCESLYFPFFNFER